MTRTPTSPGEILLEEFLEPLQLSQAALAKHIEVDYKVINRIVNGHSSLTPDIAFRLSKAFGTSPEFWLNLQQKVDIFDAQQKLKGLKFKPLKAVSV
ncbi:MAG: HigA family addiction module antitoxin [Oligoflexus sp.]